MKPKRIFSPRPTQFSRATALCAAMLFSTLSGHAQFAADNQTNIINGTAVNWPSNYYVGSNYISDALFILNGGSLSNQWGYLGYQPGGVSNLAVVSGSGSAWTNVGNLYIGYSGSANRLVISEGGKVVASGHTVVASSSGSISNSVLVTGSGSVLTNEFGSLYVGDGGSYCSLVVSNGGAVFCGGPGYVGGNFGGQSNLALVTGSGSVWRCGGNMTVGFRNGNMLIVSNGGAVFSTEGRLGYFGNARSNSVLITGNGSRWENTRTLHVGFGVEVGTDASNNRLTIADGGSVLASNAYVGFTAISSNRHLHVSGGNLTVTNLSATGFLDVRRGAVTFDGGTIRVDQLWLTRGVNSILEFNSGTLHSKGTVISNTQPCVVGDGVASANFHLLGGVHSFNDGLRIRASGLLSGCGTVNGNLLVDAGGAVVADCSALVFDGNVTNNGVLIAKNGSVLQSAGTVVNNGTIYLWNGGTTNFSGTFINNGVILSSVSPRIAGLSVVGSNVVVQVPSLPSFSYRLQTSATLRPPMWIHSGPAQSGTGSLLIFTEPGGAITGTNRFYRIGVSEDGDGL